MNSRSFSMILPALRRGESLLNSPAALRTSRFRQRCFRAAGCSPHPPSYACTDHEKLAAHSKPFSPGPSFPQQNTQPLLSEILILCCGGPLRFSTKKQNRSKKVPVLALYGFKKRHAAQARDLNPLCDCPFFLLYFIFLQRSAPNQYGNPSGTRALSVLPVRS